MPILLDWLKILYIRVPKTGSTSFINALDSRDPRHIGTVHGNAYEAKHLLGGKGEWIEYKRVGFIRHPYDWVQSAWNHWRGHPEMFVIPGGAKSFKTWLNKLQQTPVKWLCDETGRLVCEPWRTEDMTNICARLGVEELRKNVKTYDKVPLDDEARAIIRRKFAREFELGGYDA